MTRTMKTTPPNYYVDRKGHDLFWEFEQGKYPASLAIGFCYFNMLKYERRAGRKTEDPTEDFRKAKRYFREYKRLLELRRVGKIHDQGLPLALSYDNFKEREETYLARLERLEAQIKTGEAKFL